MESEEAAKRTPLTQAAASGALQELQDLVAANAADVDAQDENGVSALHAASEQGHVSVVRWLVENGARLDAIDAKGRMALHVAAMGGHVDVIRYLVQDAGVDVDVRSTTDEAPLHHAARGGQIEAVKLLLECGAELDAQDEDEQTSLFKGAVNGHCAVVEYLLDRSADVNAEETDGWQPIHGAAQSGDLSTIECLLEKGADRLSLTEDGRSVLHVAAANGALDAVKFFVGKGLAVDATTNDGQTPLFLAVWDGHREVAEFLLDAGADVNASDAEEWAPIHRSQNAETIELLMSRGANLKLLNQDGWTVLHAAAEEGNDDAAKCFVRIGAEVDATNYDDQTALFLAALNGHRDVVETLLDAGADVHAVETDGWLPLHGAAHSDNVQTSEVLLQRGANLQSLTEDGSSALHVAAEQGALDAVKFFVEKGLDVNAANNENHTPLNLANADSHREVVEYLKNAGAEVDDIEDSEDEDDVDECEDEEDVDEDDDDEDEDEDDEDEDEDEDEDDEEEDDDDDVAEEADADELSPIFVAAKLGDVENVQALLDDDSDLLRLTTDDNTLLHTAAGEGQVAAVEFFIDKGLEVDATNSEDQTPLFLAALDGHTEVVRILLDKGADVNAVEADGWRPLHGAAQSNDADTVELLLERGADIHSLTEHGRGVLHVAAQTGGLETAKLFVSKGLQVDATNNEDQTALYLAALNAHREVVEFLLNEGAGVNAVETDGWQPIHGAAESGDVEVIELLLERGAALNTVTEGGWSVLHAAATGGAVDAVKFFIERGVELNATDNDQQTALYCAALNGQRDVVEYLLDIGATVDTVDVDGWLPLHAAAHSGDVEMIELLLKHGGDPQIVTKDGSSVLHIAAEKGMAEAVEFFVERGVKVDVANEKGQTALVVAALNCHDGVVEYLLETGADISQVDESIEMIVHAAVESGNLETIDVLQQRGVTLRCQKEDGAGALHQAVWGQSISVVRALVRSGVDVETTDFVNQTVLHHAIIKRCAELVECLLEGGANVQAADLKGETPLHMATYRCDVDMIKILLKHGADEQTRNKFERSLVHFAAEFGGIAKVKLFLGMGLSIDATDIWSDTPLYLAVKSGHYRMVRYLLDHGANVNASCNNGQLPIHAAARVGDVKIIQSLLKHGAELLTTDEDGNSVLHEAAATGGVEALRIFMQNGVDVEGTNNEEETALYVSAANGHPKAVACLLDAGASLKTTSAQGWLPIHGAALSGDVETITVLVAHGADVHSMTKDGHSALYCAVIGGSEEMISFLRSQGLAVDKEEFTEADQDGWVAVHRAAKQGDLETLKALAAIGVDIHAVTASGESTLYVAADNSRNKIIEYLLKNGANVNQVDEDGWTALHAAASNRFIKSMELLIKFGADVNAKDNDGTTVLHIAALNCKENPNIPLYPGELTAVVDVLLNAEADVSAIDESNGWTTFLYAAAGGSVEILQQLFKDGANVNALAKDGKTALHIACANGLANAAEYLLGIGVSAKAVDERGQTALHCVAETEESGCVSQLLRVGGKELVAVRDQDGNQPLHLVSQSHFPEETTQLLEAGAHVNALTNTGESPLQLAVFAEKSDSAPSTISALCNFGAEWTTKCEEQLESLRAELGTSEISLSDERSQHLVWCTGLRSCILHWEGQRRKGSAELIQVPLEVIERGAASVKTYLADATSSNADELVYRCKICVVGPSEWGKSSLVKSIETSKPFMMDIRDRTIGIELVASSLQVKEPTPTPERKDDVIGQDEAETIEKAADEARPRHHEVTFWDFAGQDVYQVAHSLFFSRRTLYVLVVDVKAYLKQLTAVENLRPSALEAAMDRFLSRHVFRWVRTIFARQPDAEFLVVGTKADLLEDEEADATRVWSDLQSRVYQWKMNYMRELEEEYGSLSKARPGISVRGTQLDARIRQLSQKLTRLASKKWLVVSVTRLESIDAVREVLRSTIEANERGFPMWNKYSRVLQAINTLRAASNRPGDGQHRIEHGMMLFRPLCRLLMDEVEDLEYDECREILRTLHDLGDIIWYEHDEAGALREFIILDPMLVIDIVREVISHEHKKKSGVALENQGEANPVETPRIDGRVSHSLLETFPLWKHMDKELMYAFKMLLKQFQLVYPADDEVMDPESDLIVPCYWKAQMETASSSSSPPASPPLAQSADAVTRRNQHCWEYEISADLSDAIFEQFAVQSYTSFMKREVRANCIESTCAEFQSWMTLHPGGTKYDVIRVEVASEDFDIAWYNMRYYLMKLEKVLDGYSGLAVPRYVVVGDKRQSIAPAAKALRDSIMMGRDIKTLRTQMPWLPPDLDWFISRAWRDLSAFRDLQMMHLVRDKLDVLQKLVVKGDSQRRYPALWSLEFKSETSVAVLRMLSDLSGRCYHVPIEIEVPPSFLAKHGSKIQDGISLLSNIVPDSLSVPILQVAIDGAVSCFDAKVELATKVHNLIQRLDLTTISGDVVKTSKESGLSPGGTMAILRDLLKLHNDSLDELSITEICNLECAVTSTGDYVWAHIHEINMLKNELTPCQPRFEKSRTIDPSTPSEPSQEPETPEQPRDSSKDRASKLRLGLCVETVAGLPDWDWYKTYCKWQLVYGDQKNVLASGATTHNADSTVQPSWLSLKMPLDPVGSVEMLRECRLVVRVKRHSRIGWTKLIGEGEVALDSFLLDHLKGDFACDPISVALLASGSTATQRVVKCRISGSA